MGNISTNTYLPPPRRFAVCLLVVGLLAFVFGIWRLAILMIAQPEHLLDRKSTLTQTQVNSVKQRLEEARLELRAVQEAEDPTEDWQQRRRTAQQNVWHMEAEHSGTSSEYADSVGRARGSECVYIFLAAGVGVYYLISGFRQLRRRQSEQERATTSQVYTKDTQYRSTIKRHLVGAIIITVYVVSFFLPALGNLREKVSMSGSQAFLTSLLLPVHCGWFANPLLWVGLLFMASSRRRLAAVSGIVAVLVSTIPILFIVVSSGQYFFLIGYYIWVGSMVLMGVLPFYLPSGTSSVRDAAPGTSSADS